MTFAGAATRTVGRALALACSLLVATSAAAHAGEIIQFESLVYPPTPFKVKRAKLRGMKLPPAPRETIEGELHRPPGEGSFPAVVLMHGCGGQWRWNDVWVGGLNRSLQHRQ